MSEDRFQTHRIDNQPPPFPACNLWDDDPGLREAVVREGGLAFSSRLGAYGALAGGRLLQLADDAHRDRPRLIAYDAYGRREDRVAFNAAYHEVMGTAIAHGVAGLSWAQPEPGAHVARAALSYLHYQGEPGSSCPLTMTHAAVPVLQREAALHEWTVKAAAPHYDARFVPMTAKQGITLGMGMTEKQGGSDVRSNSTLATPLAAAGEYALVGHKWFFSAPMSDGFLVLAQAPGGLSCFLLPRWRPDGRVNALRLLRLKDKQGDWSNASSEVEFENAWAFLIGEEGRGVATILEMVMLTRLDCMLGSAGLIRMALRRALHHTHHRSAFGKRLVAIWCWNRKPPPRSPCGWPVRSTARRAMPTTPRWRGWPRQSASSGCASALRWWPPRRRSALAASATSRNRRCRACSGSRRSTRSGKAAATSSAWTCCARWAASRKPAPR